MLRNSYGRKKGWNVISPICPINFNVFMLYTKTLFMKIYLETINTLQ